jgi:hypothetical protein
MSTIHSADLWTKEAIERAAIYDIKVLAPGREKGGAARR